MRAPIPAREPERLQALRDYAVLDTPSEPAFDDIAFLAAELCGTPMAMVTFIDGQRQWFKARRGLLTPEIPREVSFCTYTIVEREILVVPDAARDPRFASNPLVTGEWAIRFYAGAPLIDAEGFALGTVAVLDHVPRDGLGPRERKALNALARQVVMQLDLRRHLLAERERSADAYATGRAHAERHASLLDASLDAIVMMDATGAVLEFNPAAERLFGYQRHEAIGRDMASLIIPPAFRERHRAGLTRNLATGHTVLTGRRVELSARRRDGTEFPVELSVQRIDAPDAAPQFVGFIRDITDRVADQRERLATEKRYLYQREAAIALNQLASLHRGDFERSVETITEVAARTMDVARVSVWRYTPDHRTLRCVCLYELAEDRFSHGVELTEAAYPAYFRALADSHVLAANDAESDPRTAELASDYLRPAGITSVLDASIRLAGGVDGIISHEHVGPPRRWTTDEESFAIAVASMCSLALEAAERRQSNTELLASRQRVEDIVNTVDGIVWQADAKSLAFSFVSEQAERILGYPTRRWTQEPTFWRDHVHPDDRDGAIAHCREALRTMQPHEFEYRMIAQDGREVWLKDFVTPVGSNGSPAELRGIMVDVTGQRQLAEQLRQSQRLDAVGQLAGGIAHDFNNILTVIQGYTSLLSLGDGTHDEDVREAVEQIGKAAERAAGLTRQLLAFSRRQVLQPTGLDLNRIVRDMSRMLRRTLGEHIDLQVQEAPQLPSVYADAGMMEQVLLNVVLNARDAMPGGGRLSIGTSVEEITPEFVRDHPDATPGRFVCLRVSDSGVGMPPEMLARVFEPFFTTKDVNKGTGLGLATAYGIVRQHRGWITVESAPGAGTTFRIYLPVGAPSAEPEPEFAPAAAPRARGGTETVLVVEDEEPVRQLARRLLENAGYTVHEAGDGRAALTVWEQHKDEISLIVTDMVMPGGMTGLELATRLRAERVNLPVVVTSGYSADVFGHELEHRDGLSFLQKPYKKGALVRAVRDRLDAARAIGDNA
ncbi:MAG TPA: PAS domain S-box protein [Gemmatimonadaceae bacterium]|nr:PAS domain S-box protein [Gemmatimonadaceae bacterium]